MPLWQLAVKGGAILKNGRKPNPRCTHDNCFTCPYDECRILYSEIKSKNLGLRPTDKVPLENPYVIGDHVEQAYVYKLPFTNQWKAGGC